MKKCIIIYSGFNQRAVIAFLRTLEANHITYAIIAKSKDDSIFDSSYQDKVITIRQSIPLDLNDIKNTIKQVIERIEADEYIIAPSTEALNRFILSNREQIEVDHVTIPLTSKTNYESVSDKYSFGELCKKYEIIIPEEIANENKLKIPCVAKPKKYFSEDRSIHNPYIILNEKDKVNFLKACKLSDFYFQEFISGKSFYLLYYFQRNGKVFKFSQENIIQQPEGKSIVAAIASNFHESEESLKYENLFKSAKFYGFVMVEIKQDGDKNYMIEANPRFWGPSQLFVDAGMNFFELFLYEYGVLNEQPIFFESTKDARYFWYGGVVETFKKQKELTYYQGNFSQLIKDLPNWLQSDVYRRNDTYHIFKNELF